MKKWISIFCLAVMLLAMLPVSALPIYAEESGGTCGDNLTWTHDGSVLTISGTGAMNDYSEENLAPWTKNNLLIHEIRIEDGVTTIGSYAFVGNEHLMLAVIPKSVTSIGSKAFYGCGARLTSSIYYLGNAPQIAEDAYLDAKNMNYTVLDWDASAQLDYGAKKAGWTKTSITIPYSANRLFALNWEFKPEDIRFFIPRSSQTGIPYIPQQVTFGPYDNSTYGEKTVTVTADGYTFEFIYYVTDGTNHFDLIRVEFPDLKVYNGNTQTIRPTLTMGSQELTEFNVSFDHPTAVGTDGQITVTGAGKIAGYEKTFYYPVVRADISNAYINCKSFAEFTGEPIVPDVNVSMNGFGLREGKDYKLILENNVNMGLATVRIVGMGNYYGEARKVFRIEATDTYPSLKGSYLGQYGEELSENYKVIEGIFSPAVISGRIFSDDYHMAWYRLYQVVGEELVLITERQTEPGYHDKTRFVYDFSHVYEEASEDGGAVYVLEYTWIDTEDEIYGGMLVMGFPAKVPDATAMSMSHVKQDGNFRTESLNVKGNNGELGEVLWTSSDAAVATVEKGMVTLHKPGTAVISAQYGDMVKTHTVTATQQDLTQGIIFDYTEARGARVVWDNYLLTEGSDYTLETVQSGNGITVTVTGCGLFAGQLEKTFDGPDSLAYPHTHSYTNSCDSTCNGCGYQRVNDHTYSQQWIKDQLQHWHACIVCGEKKDVENHTLLPSDRETCAVCGTLWIPGDMNGDYQVDNQDVEYLLWYTLFPESYPLLQSADYNGDGMVNNQDVEYLLWHTLFPESYPI